MNRSGLCITTLLALWALNLPAQTPKVMKWVGPSYPVLAKIAERSGVVRVFLTINAQGTVERAIAAGVNDFSANNHVAQLCPNAIEAAKQWQFEPGKENREFSLFFAYQLFPPETNELHLQNEFIAPNIILIKAAVPIIEHPIVY